DEDEVDALADKLAPSVHELRADKPVFAAVLGANDPGPDLRAELGDLSVHDPLHCAFLPSPLRGPSRLNLERGCCIRALRAVPDGTGNVSSNRRMPAPLYPNPARPNQPLRSRKISRAALWPGAPVTPPPGWAPEPQR